MSLPGEKYTCCRNTHNHRCLILDNLQYRLTLPRLALCLLHFSLPFTGNTNPKLQCSVEEMIYPETFSGVTPLHALAIACTDNLPPSGLGNSLTVTNLPSSYTPRILLKLFQARYPSAYRATIPPVAMEGRKV